MPFRHSPNRSAQKRGQVAARNDGLAGVSVKLTGVNFVETGMTARKSSNAFVIWRAGACRTFAANAVETQNLSSTLIEACASFWRGFAISNEEQSDV